MVPAAHFIWLGMRAPVEMDQVHRVALHTFIRHNPSWGVVVWGNESISDLLDTEQRKSVWKAIGTRLGRVNYARILALLRYPGVVLDYDTLTKAPLDWLLTEAGNNILVPEILGKPGAADVWLMCAGQGAADVLQAIEAEYPACVEAASKEYQAEDTQAIPKRTRFERRYADILFDLLNAHRDRVMTVDMSQRTALGRPVPVKHYAMRSWLILQQKVGNNGT